MINKTLLLYIKLKNKWMLISVASYIDKREFLDALNWIKNGKSRFYKYHKKNVLDYHVVLKVDEFYLK